MDRKSLLASLFLSLGIACGPMGPANVDKLTLPGDKYYPESISSAKDGTLYVGSLATGQVVKFAPQSTTAEVLIAPGILRSALGVLVDDSDSLLYVCDNDLSPKNPGLPAVRSFHLEDGREAASYPFPVGGFCNDLGFDGNRNLYVTDSTGKIYRLPKGKSALTLFSDAAALAPSSSQGFGADGIIWDGASSLYVNTFSDSRLLRFPIHADGSAGAPEQVTVTPALSFPDGMRLLADQTLLVVEGAGRLSHVAISGTTATATTLADKLDGPTSVVQYEKEAWVTEGQLGHFLGTIAGPPSTPFLVRRVAIP